MEKKKKSMGKRKEWGRNVSLTYQDPEFGSNGNVSESFAGLLYADFENVAVVDEQFCVSLVHWV